MADKWVSIFDANAFTAGFLMAHDAGKISFEGQGFGPFSIFHRQRLESRTYAFKNLGSGLYLATNAEGETGQDPEIGERQRWKEVRLDDGRVALMGYTNRFLSTATVWTKEASIGATGMDFTDNHAYVRQNAIYPLEYRDPPSDLLPDGPTIDAAAILNAGELQREADPSIDIAAVLRAGELRKEPSKKPPRVVRFD